MNKEAQDFYVSHKEKLIQETGGTWYSVTPEDFEMLLKEPSIQTLLHRWFKVSVETKNKRVEVVLPTGQLADLSKLYIEIQSDPKMSYEVYQIGMSIWR